ncbi:MAG TPA: hypothetical protein VMN60_12520 [Longimicrobiales bacterium]|nr:hypothetical protein [Longimicrobiales bacterium]
MRTMVTGLMLLTVMSTACGETPLAPVAEMMHFADVSWGAAGMPMLHQDHELSLEHLFRTAVRQVAAQDGAEAARALVSGLAPLREAVQSARQAQDRAGAEAAQAALRAAMAEIVVTVLGDDVAASVIASVSAARADLSARLAALPRPNPRMEELLVRVDALLAEAASASPARALDLATQAAALTAQVRFAVVVRAQIPSLGQLVDQARRSALQANGRDATLALFTPLHDLMATLRTAHQSGDRAAAEAARTAVRAEQIRIVVTVLGAEPVHRVLDATAAFLMQAAERIAAARAGGHDVTRMETRLQQAAQLHADATAAKEAGELARALDAALRAAEAAMGLLRH